MHGLNSAPLGRGAWSKPAFRNGKREKCDKATDVQRTADAIGRASAAKPAMTGRPRRRPNSAKALCPSVLAFKRHRRASRGRASTRARSAEKWPASGTYAPWAEHRTLQIEKYPTAREVRCVGAVVSVCEICGRALSLPLEHQAYLRCGKTVGTEPTAWSERSGKTAFNRSR